MADGDISREDEATLKQIIRSIDKKLDYSLVKGGDDAGPGPTLRLTRKAWTGTMNLDIDDLQAAKTDLALRNRIRQKIKGLRDHMWDSRSVKDVMGKTTARMIKESAQNDDYPKRTFTPRSRWR